MKKVLSLFLLIASLSSTAFSQWCPGCIQNSADAQNAQFNISSATIRGPLKVGSINLSSFTATSSVTAQMFFGSGTYITGLDAAQITYGSIPPARLVGSYPQITSIGALSGGVWNGSIIGSQYGGTGANLVTSNPGSIPYFVTVGTMAALPPTTAGALLQTNGALAPSWTLSPQVFGTNIIDIPMANLTPGQLPSDITINDASISTVSAAKVIGNIPGKATNITGNLALTQLSTGTLVTTIVASSITATGVVPGIYGGPNQLPQFNVLYDGRISGASQSTFTVYAASIAAGALPAGVTIGASQITAGNLGPSVIASSVNATGVTAGAYGYESQVSSIVVTSDGRIHFAKNVRIAINTDQINNGTLTAGVVVPAVNVQTGVLGLGVIASSVAATGLPPGTYGSPSHTIAVTFGADGRASAVALYPVTGIATSTVFNNIDNAWIAPQTFFDSITVHANLSANNIAGDGSGITNLQPTQISGGILNPSVVASSVSIPYLVVPTSVTAATFFGNGSGLTGLSTSSFNGGTVANETDFLSSVTVQNFLDVRASSINAAEFRVNYSSLTLDVSIASITTPSVIMRAFNGVLNNKTPLAPNTVAGVFGIAPYDTTPAYLASAASISFATLETPSPTAHGASATIGVTPIGSTTRQNVIVVTSGTVTLGSNEGIAMSGAKGFITNSSSVTASGLFGNTVLVGTATANVGYFGTGSAITKLNSNGDIVQAFNANLFLNGPGSYIQVNGSSVTASAFFGDGGGINNWGGGDVSSSVTVHNDITAEGLHLNARLVVSDIENTIDLGDKVDFTSGTAYAFRWNGSTIIVQSASGPSGINMRASGGSIISPTVLGANTQFGLISATGWDGSVWPGGPVAGGAPIGINFFTDEVFNSGAHGSYANIQTTPDGSINRRTVMTWAANGRVGVSTGTPQAALDVNGSILSNSSVTASAFFGNGAGLTGMSAFNGGTVTNETDFLSSVTIQNQLYVGDPTGFRNNATLQVSSGAADFSVYTTSAIMESQLNNGGNAPAINLRGYNVVAGARSALTSGQNYGFLGFGGYDSANPVAVNPAAIFSGATENWNTGAHGNNLNFGTTQNGTATRTTWMTLTGNGFLAINNSNARARIHMSTGAMIVDGTGAAITVVGGSVTANAFFGDGGNVTNLTPGNITAGVSAITGLGTQAQALNMGTHLINNVVDPVSAQDAATKNYVDTNFGNLQYKQSARLATTAALPANAYNNGASGVGATLTGLSIGGLTVDGASVNTGDRLLINNEVVAANNGIYAVTQVGSLVVYILTRATDYNTAAEMTNGSALFIDSGTVNTDAGFINVSSVTTVGTDPIHFSQFNGLGNVTAGAGLLKSGNTLTVDSSSVAFLNSGNLITYPGATSGGVAFFTGSSVTENASFFFWDNTNHRLGLRNSAPAFGFHVSSVTFYSDGNSGNPILVGNNGSTMTLTSAGNLTIAGALTAATSSVTASGFFGDGYHLTNVTVSSCTMIPNTTFTNAAFTVAVATITMTTRGRPVVFRFNGTIQNTGGTTTTGMTPFVDSAFTVEFGTAAVRSTQVIAANKDTGFGMDPTINNLSAASHTFALMVETSGGTGTLLKDSGHAAQLCVSETP